MTSTGRRGYVGIDRHWLNNPDLSDSALRLMLWLDSHSHEYLRDLSIKRTALEIGWSRDRVSRTLELLVELGLVSTEQVPHPDGGKTRTMITLHQDLWSDGYATRRGIRMPHGEAQGMPHGEAPTTSTPSVRNELLGVSVVRDDDAPPAEGYLCDLLADAIEKQGGKRPTVGASWLTDMERMIRIDKRTPAEIERCIYWLTSETDDIAIFWAPNIRSPEKLRSKFDQMRAQSAASKKKAKPESTMDRIRRANS
jgi:hypothetical protein